jgi:hypothetical protein
MGRSGRTQGAAINRGGKRKPSKSSSKTRSLRELVKVLSIPDRECPQKKTRKTAFVKRSGAKSGAFRPRTRFAGRHRRVAYAARGDPSRHPGDDPSGGRVSFTVSTSTTSPPSRVAACLLVTPRRSCHRIHLRPGDPYFWCNTGRIDLVRRSCCARSGPSQALPGPCMASSSNANSGPDVMDQVASHPWKTLPPCHTTTAGRHFHVSHFRTVAPRYSHWLLPIKSEGRGRLRSRRVGI